VLALALAVSYAVWERERREIERVLKEDFDQRVHDAVNVFRERVQGYEQVLRAVSGLFASSRKVERIDFQTFVRNLKMRCIPGLQGVATRCSCRGELERHLAAVRAEGFPSYADPPAGRAAVLHLAIFFAPPSAAELSTIGSDYSPSRRAAPRSSRRATRAGVAVSNKIRLPGEDGREIQPGFRMVWPVYRNGAPLGTVRERARTSSAGSSPPSAWRACSAAPWAASAAAWHFEVFDGSELQGEGRLRPRARAWWSTGWAANRRCAFQRGQAREAGRPHLDGDGAGAAQLRHAHCHQPAPAGDDRGRRIEAWRWRSSPGR
jgi:hypothetical protein